MRVDCGVDAWEAVGAEEYVSMSMSRRGEGWYGGVVRGVWVVVCMSWYVAVDV